VGVGSGTDAIALTLRAAGIGAGDEVVLPAYTATATWTAVASTGATPVGADVDPDSGLIDPDSASSSVGPRTAALIAVHLFGRLAPLAALRALADRHGLLLVEDCAHAHGATEDGLRAAELGDAAAYSFYPTKLLGALGDAGAVLTRDAGLARSVRLLRSNGQGWPPGDAPRVGVNSRIDELQAAVLRARLPGLDRRRERLRQLAARYRAAMKSDPGLGMPPLPSSADEPAWHQFVVTHPERERLREELARRGVGTAVHYDPLPPGLSAFGSDQGFPIATALSRRVLSLPFDPWLTDEQAAEVCDAVAEASSSISSRS
jgi:dTDP-4-amino-4,6-dideoxygalactose transaminase